MKKQRKTNFRIIISIALIAALICVSIIGGQLILKRMESYIEANGKNNMATVMEQMSQSYDIQVNAYFSKLEQTERFLFQDGRREISQEKSKAFFDSIAPEDAERLLFMKNNGEVTTTDGRKTRLDIQSRMLIDLHQDQKIAQSVTLSSNGTNGNYFLIAIPCETYTVDGENYNAIAVLLDRTNIDTMLELNGYGGEAYIFLVDGSGIVNYTNQPGEYFYRNYALLKQLRKNKGISDAQYDALLDAVQSKQQTIELFDGNGAPFYLGCYPVTNSNHRLICIVARSVVNNSLIAYQKTVIRVLVGYMGIVFLLSVALVCISFQVSISNKKVAYEEEKRKIQEKAMQELEMAKNRADAANRAKSDFLSNMSHDIRTPMNAIVGITKLMEHERNDPEKVEMYIHKVQTSSKHLLSLINDVLDMSKIESGGVTLNRETVSLADQVWQVDSIVHPQVRERKQHFEIRLHDIVHEFFIGDAVRVRQIIINLLSNAIKYTPEGGCILFEVSELESGDGDIARIQFSVKDTGCGMTQKKKKWGDRRDAVWLKDLPSMNRIMPCIMPNRADNEAFVSVDIDYRPLEAYLQKKNEGLTEDKYTFFHVIAAAIGKAFVLRPKMNRFVCNYRVYQRNEISIAFTVKKKFSDKAEESLAFFTYDEKETMDSFHEKIMKVIHITKSDVEKDTSTGAMDMLVKLPQWMINLLTKIVLWLDKHGWAPQDLIGSDPNHSSIFLSNLGSIGLEVGYHHLVNWGTNSCFIVLGKKHLKKFYNADGTEDLHEVVPLGITLDERIADGYYYSGTIALVKKLLENPELLDAPADTPVEYSIKR